MSDIKVRVIGLDGADWKILNPWIKRGKLPFFHRLVENGVSGVLKSTFPTLSGPAWTSIITGKNPAKHGIVEWLIKDEDKVINSRAIDGKKLWNFFF